MESRMLMDDIEKSDLLIGAFGHGHHPGGVSVNCHFPDYDIFHTLSGAYRLTINGQVYVARPGDTFLMVPDTHLVLEALEDSHQYYLHFSLMGIGKLAIRGDFEDYRIPCGLTALTGMFGDSMEAYLRNPSSQEYPLKMLLKLIVIEMIRLSPGNTVRFISPYHKSHATQINRILRYIHAHPDTALNGSDLSTYLGCSRSYLSRTFKKATGTALSSYIEQVRMQAGARLLKESGTTIKEVALQLGFPDPFVFSKKFKRVYGVAPSAFKMIEA